MKSLLVVTLVFTFLSQGYYGQESSTLNLNIKVFLQGCYEDGFMYDDLNKENLIDLKQPYKESPWFYTGSEEVDKIPDNIVDWVLVELLNDSQGSEVLAKRAAFLRSDGIITDIDGKNYLQFNNTIKEFYIAVIHRNHLPVVSGSRLINSGSLLKYDFTTGTDLVKNESSLVSVGNDVFAMTAGDSDSNGEINNADFKNIADNLLKTGYMNCDLDLNGIVNVLDYKMTNLNISKKTNLPYSQQY